MAFYAEDAIINYTINQPFYPQICWYFLIELVYKVSMAAERELTHEFNNMGYLSISVIGLHCYMPSLCTVWPARNSEIILFCSGKTSRVTDVSLIVLD